MLEQFASECSIFLLHKLDRVCNAFISRLLRFFFSLHFSLAWAIILFSYLVNFSPVVVSQTLSHVDFPVENHVSGKLFWARLMENSIEKWKEKSFSLRRIDNRREFDTFSSVWVSILPATMESEIKNFTSMEIHILQPNGEWNLISFTIDTHYYYRSETKKACIDRNIKMMMTNADASFSK